MQIKLVLFFIVVAVFVAANIYAFYLIAKYNIWLASEIKKNPGKVFNRLMIEAAILALIILLLEQFGLLN